MIKTLPVLLLKNLILLPMEEVKIELNNDFSREIIMLSDKSYQSEVLIVCPKDTLEEIPDVNDLPLVGVIGHIKSKIELPNGHLRVVFEGLKRVSVCKYYNKTSSEILHSEVEEIILPKFNEAEEIASKKKLIELLKEYIHKNPTMPNTILGLIKEEDTLDELTDKIVSNFSFSTIKKLAYMEEINPLKRSKLLLKDINVEIEVLKIDEQLNMNLETRLEDSQKEFVLREKLKEIQKLLGEQDEKQEDVFEWEEKLNKLSLDSKTMKKIQREINKFSKMNEMSPDASFVRNYLDTFFSLPWKEYTMDETDMEHILNSLNKSHYGLEEVKQRIIEFIAVRKRNPNLRSPILCLVGPPGVGKTSIAMSIASSLNKEFYKISLGGLNDATELSGNRRTYIGSSPGKIIEALIKCGSKNPVLLLDEVDKMTKDYKGDPASVLLDVLDYPQNETFIDNYIEEPFDLSNVFFILTANDLTKIPVELKDRLEIIELSSYTLYEKISLAREYLLPEIYETYSLTKEELTIPDGTISSIIRHYTLEAGVRDLKRNLDRLVRKILTSSIRSHRKLQLVVEEKDLKKYLGVYQYEEDILPKTTSYGLVNALSWTPLGGHVIAIESCDLTGNGKILMTGSLKDVMKESIDVSYSYVKSHKKELAINDYSFSDKDIHLHVLDGATPKDGPSAGVAITTALVSLFTKKIINKDIAMTGEMTLRGDILPVGGIKEKLIGAYNAGIHTVFLPKQNKNELKKVPEYVINNLNIVFVSNYKEIYKQLFQK